MVATVADIVDIMEKIAPSRLAESWDNSGLQAGKKNWPVKNIQVALDPLPGVVAAACEKDIDLLITHHPLLFRPIKSVDLDTPAGSIIGDLIKNRVALFSAHTNLDSSIGGVNNVLADRIGLRNLEVLQKCSPAEIFKLVVYVPVEYEEKILHALFETPAGRIGPYSSCSFRNRGKGAFKPDVSAKPFTGEAGDVSHVDETRIETIVEKDDISAVIQRIEQIHPYETMAHDLYPLKNSEGKQGLGRVGELEKPMDLGSFAIKIRDELGIAAVRVAGESDLRVTRAAVCSGSGGGLMDAFFSSGAEVYISGDMRYHDARDVEAASKGLIDIGHFNSEHLIVDVVVERLQKLIAERGMNINIESCGLENDPFRHV